ncbi:MAG: ATP synthase F1 subunit delta [Alphaproteobacteria bacterium]|nr:ATP synthase F1 subunit delta [Alphaproteobacteria bacterium]
MNQTSRIAQRYSESLFKVAIQQKQLKNIESDFDRLSNVLAENSGFSQALKNPTVPRGSMKNMIADVSDLLKLSQLTTHFLKLLATNRRTDMLLDMIAHFKELGLSHNNQLRVNVTSSTPISNQQMELLQEALNKKTSKDVLINLNTDPSILGGLIINYGSSKLDFSIRRKLNDLKHELERLG